MIVRHFINWVRTASAGDRADATRALARAWLVSDLSEDDRAAAEGALLMMLDDPSPLVRQAMAQVFARSEDAPAVIVRALAQNPASVASPVLEHSPLLTEADLIDIVATGDCEVQCAIARRMHLTAPVCAAIAEVGCAEATLELTENPLADVPRFSLSRIIERHGHLGAIRETLLARDDLPAASRAALMEKLSQTLTRFVAGKDWLSSSRAERVAVEACERATMQIASASHDDDLAALITHLRLTGQLTAGLILRAILSGNFELFVDALSQLTDLPPGRVEQLLERRGAGIDALLGRAGVPASTVPAFRAAIEASRAMGFAASLGGGTRLRRQLVEHVLAQCENDPSVADGPLMILLRRFETESAREEARLFCDELAVGGDVHFHADHRMAA